MKIIIIPKNAQNMPRKILSNYGMKLIYELHIECTELWKGLLPVELEYFKWPLKLTIKHMHLMVHTITRIDSYIILQYEFLIYKKYTDVDKSLNLQACKYRMHLMCL